MMEEKEIIDKRAEKIKSWIKKPANLLIMLILIGAFALHLYYLNLANGQTLWWDEAEYMSTAKHWAFGVPYELNEQRPPLFQLAAAFLLYIGFGEYALKLILVVLPATLLIYLTYIIIRELFNEKIGLFSALASAGMWSYLFWGARFQPDFLSMCFQLLSIFYFWKIFKEPNKKYAILAGVYAALGFYFKISALLVPASAFVFALFKNPKKLIKNRYYWLSFIAFIVTLIPFMIWQYASFGNPLAFAPSYGVEGGSSDRPLGWETLNFFYVFPKGLFFALFLIGILFILSRILIGFDIIIKDEKRREDSKIYSIIILLVVTAFYIFYIQGTIEDRWVFLITPFIFAISGYGVLIIFDKLKIKKPAFRGVLIIVLFAIFFYYQIGHATLLIENKIPSYQPVKDAALWIKENSNESDAIVSASYTQMTNYAERLVYPYMPRSPNETAFASFLEEKKPRYMMLSVFEGHPGWAFQKLSDSKGDSIFTIPYLNSTIAINQQGQVVLIDIKQSVQKKEFKFSFVYPKNQLNGAFIYEIEYVNNSN